ncbi:MAG: DUF1992 domain-containing protein [Myxococcales bacterium]|nr:DUF1992 domain-containing protein [Myxococcales bacterium]
MTLKSVEQQIQQARARGEFDNLKNRGKPLDHEAYFRAPEDMRVAYHLLGNAGFVPREVELQREIGELRDALGQSTDPETRQRLRREIERRRIQVEQLLHSR